MTRLYFLNFVVIFAQVLIRVTCNDPFESSLQEFADVGYSKLPKATESTVDIIIDDIMKPFETLEEVVEDGTNSWLTSIKKLVKEWFYMGITAFILFWIFKAIIRGCRTRQHKRRLKRMVSEMVAENLHGAIGESRV